MRLERKVSIRLDNLRFRKISPGSTRQKIAPISEIFAGECVEKTCQKTNTCSSTRSQVH